MQKRKYQHQGFIGTIILIIAAIIILGYYKIDLRTVISAPVVKSNLNYSWQLFMTGVIALWNYLTHLIQQILPH